MLKIYDTNRRYVGYVEDIKNLRIEESLAEGFKTLSFEAPCLEELYVLLQEEYYLVTKDYNYVIKEVNFSGNKFFEVRATADIEDFYSNFFSAFDCFEKNLQQAYEYTIQNTGWTLDYRSENESQTTYQLPNVTALEMVKTIADDYLQELWFDTKNKVLTVYDQMGKQLGAYYTNELKLENLKKQSSTYDFATVLTPIGKDGLTITEINNGKDFIENFEYANKYIHKVWINEDYDVAERLKAAAELHLASIAEPKASYKLKLTDLGDTVQLGDTVLLIDKLKRIKQKQRVVKIVRFPDRPEDGTLELSNIQADFSREFIKREKLRDKEIAYIKKQIEALK